MLSLGLNIYGKKHKRDLQFVMGDSDIPNSGYLSDCNLEYCSDVIFHIEKIIKGEIREYEWGQNRIYITSHQITSELEDIIYDESLGEVPTQLLLDLMKQWRDFLNDWLKEDKLEKEVKKAFSEIKNNQKSTLKAEGLSRYETKASDDKTTINLVLEDEDFRLSPAEYFDEISFSNRCCYTK